MKKERERERERARERERERTCSIIQLKEKLYLQNNSRKSGARNDKGIGGDHDNSFWSTCIYIEIYRKG